MGESFPTDELIFFRGVGQPPTRDSCRQLDDGCSSPERWSEVVSGAELQNGCEVLQSLEGMYPLVN